MSAPGIASGVAASWMTHFVGFGEGAWWWTTQPPQAEAPTSQSIASRAVHPCG